MSKKGLRRLKLWELKEIASGGVPGEGIIHISLAVEEINNTKEYLKEFIELATKEKAVAVVLSCKNWLAERKKTNEKWGGGV